MTLLPHQPRIHASTTQISCFRPVNSLNYPDLAAGNLSKIPHAESETAFRLATSLGEPEHDEQELEALPGRTRMLTIGASPISPETISMNDRQRAISILSYARDVLAERLTEAVLDQDDQILDDAEGLSYTSDISTIDEKLGAKLRTINSLISSLPTTDPSETPLSDAESSSDVPATPDFALFAGQIAGGDTNKASQTLTALLGLDAERARKATEVFQNQLQEDPEFMAKAMQLRKEVNSGNVNASLMLIWTCFGLQGPPAIEVLQAMRSM